MSTNLIFAPGESFPESLRRALLRVLCSGTADGGSVVSPTKEVVPAPLLLNNGIAVCTVETLLKTGGRTLKKRPQQPLLVFNEKSSGINRVVLKYAGEDTHAHSFPIHFPTTAISAESTVVISPIMFNGKGVLREKLLIKTLLEKYGGLGFIKLPFLHLEQFLDYMQQNRVDLLILPAKDFPEFLKVPALPQRLQQYPFSIFFA